VRPAPGVALRLPRRLAAAAVLLSLSACDGRPWNDPHAAEREGQRVFYSLFSSRTRNLDPVRTYNRDEATLIDNIYEPPLEYHYLKRPYELQPLTLERMPEVVYYDEAGAVLPATAPAPAYSVYTLTLKRGIRYQPHPAFAVDAAGEPLYRFADARQSRRYKTLDDFAQSGTRELRAEDYVYQIKRMADPELQLPIWDIVSGYIVGLTELREAIVAQRAAGSGWLNLQTLPLEGVQVLDPYTFTIRLRGKYPQFKYWLAFHFFAPIPMEVDRFYAQPGLRDRNISLAFYPVGTGAFMMTRHQPTREIVLERNPNYHEDYYPRAGEPGDAEAGLLTDAGKPLPFLDKVVFSMEKEPIPAWTKFMQGYYDVSGVNRESFDQAVKVNVDGIGLSDEMIARGIVLFRTIDAATYYLGFNMTDEVVGGDSERARKLRRAIAIAYDESEQISIFLNGRGEVAMSPVPPGIFGYRPGRAGLNPYVFDWRAGAVQRKPLEEARRLLAEAGYPRGRDARSGRPLVLNMDMTSGSSGDSARQVWLIKQFEKIDIQLNIRATDYNRFQEKMEKGAAQLFFWGWFADYPDAENFLFLLYGPNGRAGSGGAGVNSANYSSARYDALFDRVKTMEDTPERMALIEQMLAIFHRDLPWASAYHPQAFVLNNGWVKNFKPHGVSQATLKYLDVDLAARARSQREWNRPVWWPLALLGLALLVVTVPGYRAYRARQRRSVVGEEGSC